MNTDEISVFPFSRKAPSTKDILNNLHKEGEISLAHSRNNLVGRPSEALLISHTISCLSILLGLSFNTIVKSVKVIKSTTMIRWSKN